MATNANALKAVYEALGGEEELVNPTNLEVLNKIAELGGGDPQTSNARAIIEIAENLPSGGGGEAVKLVKCKISNSSGLSIQVESTELDENTNFYVRKRSEVIAGRTINFWLLAHGFCDDGVTPHAQDVLHITYNSGVGNTRTVSATKGVLSADALSSNYKEYYAVASADFETGELEITVATA